MSCILATHHARIYINAILRTKCVFLGKHAHAHTLCIYDMPTHALCAYKYAQTHTLGIYDTSFHAHICTNTHFALIICQIAHCVITTDDI
jgi:hypothetical protein